MRIRRPPPRCWKSMLGAPGMCSCMLGRNFSFESIDEPMASDMPYVYSTTYDRVKTSLIDGDGFLSCWCNCMFRDTNNSVTTLEIYILILPYFWGFESSWL
ncbi:hypothetical protein VPH35_066144 [Triticum aestivum]|uniref:Uncharacterized protein n=2 Tax=Triticum urartu TaxID=4572 RepID=A0A8R7UUA5_TRIUA